jgi:hypothetical protein
VPPTNATRSPHARRLHAPARGSTASPVRFYSCAACRRVWHWHDLGGMDRTVAGPMCPGPCRAVGRFAPVNEWQLGAECLRRVIARLGATEVHSDDEGHALAVAMRLLIGSLRDIERRLR